MAKTVKRQMAPVGTNRTGIGAAPKRAAAMLRGMEEFPPSSTGDGTELAQVRIEYAAAGIPTGSIPETGSRGQKADATMAPLLDKLGARLAFERNGTRLYEGLLSKLDASGSFSGGPSREDLLELRNEEEEHFRMLEEAIEELGGDPTAVTPCANLELTAGVGILQVISDPRTSLLESLEAMIVAELADNECWETLVDLAAAQELDALADRCRRALEDEDDHLRRVREWIAAGQGREPS